MKNLIDYFNRGLLVDAYLDLLGDQKALHDLHYKRADITNISVAQPLPELKILVITEPWCGDSTAILPVLLKFFENKTAEFRIVLRDENPQLMDMFLTNGARAIPIVVVMDRAGNYLFHFGPRPKVVQQIFESYRPLLNQGSVKKVDVIKKIRQFYAADRGQAILDEFVTNLMEIVAFR